MDSAWSSKRASMFGKIAFTLKNFKEIAYHHYGNSPLSLVKFVYYSVFRINTFIVFERDLTGALPEINLGPEYNVLKPTTDELDRIRNGKVLPREFYYDKFHKVKTCYLALYHNEIAYIHWVYFKGDSSRFLRLGDGVAEINYVTVLPRFRGKKLSCEMLCYTSRDLKALGYKKVVVVVHENTIALIKNLKQAEYREVRRIKVLGPFSRKIHV
jgi:hypothetical protein